MKRWICAVLFLTPVVVLGQTLIDQVRAGNLDEVKTWLHRGKNIEKDFVIVSLEGDTLITDLMSFAASYGHLDIVNYFIAHEHLFAPFQLWLDRSVGAAVMSGNYELVEIIIKEGADVNYVSDLSLQRTPVSLALALGEEKIFRLLQVHGAVYKEKGQNEVFHAAVQGAHFETLLEIYNDENADVNALSPEGYVPLWYSISSGRTDVAQFLLDKGADTLVKSEFGETLMHAAIISGKLETVKWTLQLLGKDFAFQPNKPYPVIHEAVLSKNPDILEFLVEQGINIKEKNTNGQSALFMCLEIWEERSDMMYILLKNGLKLEAKDKYQRTIEDYAKYHRDKFMLKLIRYYEKVEF